MGENITTRGVDLLALPTGTRFDLGASAVVEVTGLRNPCAQLDGIQPGLMAATLARDERGELVRKAGVMAIVTPAERCARAIRSASSCRPRRTAGSSRSRLVYSLRSIFQIIPSVP